MEEKNIILHKSYSFALDIINSNKYLKFKRDEHELSKQLSRSVTTIKANAEEANGAVTKRDFANKMSIALKECTDSHYWIRLLRNSKPLEIEKAYLLLEERTQIKGTLIAILKTTQNNL